MSRLSNIFEHMGKHPGMYFGGGDRRSIHYVAAFIMGREEGAAFPDDPFPDAAHPGKKT